MPINNHGIPRLYILGLNSPQSSDPRMALWPDPPGCAGHRLWSMVTEACGITVRDWLRCTQRVNLLSCTTLPRDYRGAARRRGEYLSALIQGRTVVLLGTDVANALGHGAGPLEWGTRDWVMIPHP